MGKKGDAALTFWKHFKPQASIEWRAGWRASIEWRTGGGVAGGGGHGVVSSDAISPLRNTISTAHACYSYPMPVFALDLLDCTLPD
jgi:hypothetical protein